MKILVLTCETIFRIIRKSILDFEYSNTLSCVLEIVNNFDPFRLKYTRLQSHKNL